MPQKMTKYLIKLKPLDTFFFSQENKYRKKLKKDKSGKMVVATEADYFQTSAYFPQQTTLLGMLRYYILLKNKQIPIAEKTTAEKLIGGKSFDVGEPNPDFKTIKNLSAVFIIDENNNFYFQNPQDLILEEDKLVYLNKSLAPFKSNLSREMLFFENYVEKDGLSNFLISSETDFLPYDFDKKEAKNGIFIKKEKIGITKKKDGETDKNAFYKQVFYSLIKGYSFGFIAELDDLEEHTGIVSMGAEKSPFAISFKKFEGEIENKISLKTVNSPKIILLSDTYLSDYNTKDFQFAISSTKTFRFLKTEIKKGNRYYSSDPLKKEEIKRSVKYSLIERGSVFYFKDENQMNGFADKLKRESNFNQIGYNQHKKIT
jgi:CRISPR-associated protein Cmr3